MAYKRLARVFRDQTRPTGLDPTTGRQGQEFTHPSCETHLTVTLWENFAILPAESWLYELWSIAGLQAELKSTPRCNWSYQWAEHGKRGARHCDIVLEYEDADGRGVLVVEAKRPGGLLKDKDLDPAYYLGIPELAAFRRRSLLYLLDERTREAARLKVNVGDHDVGFITWTELASVQLDAASCLALPEELRAFVAGSVHRSFVERGIVPAKPPLPYLADEPTAEDFVTKRAGEALGEADWCRQLWRLPIGD